MKKRVLKKSEVLREGYEQGLREGLSVINQMIAEATSNATKKQRSQDAAFVQKSVRQTVSDIMALLENNEDEILQGLQQSTEDSKNGNDAVIVSFVDYGTLEHHTYEYIGCSLKRGYTDGNITTRNRYIGLECSANVYKLSFNVAYLKNNDFEFINEELKNALTIGVKNLCISGNIVGRGDEPTDAFVRNRVRNSKNSKNDWQYRKEWRKRNGSEATSQRNAWKKEFNDMYGFRD